MRWRGAWRPKAVESAARACPNGDQPPTMRLLCEPCRDVTELATNLVVLEAQVILFVDAHSAQDGHAVRVRVG